MNNRLLYYSISDVLVCLVIGVVNIFQKSCSYGFAISFLAESILMIAFIVLLQKNFLNALIRDCYLIISCILCQILQIEFSEQKDSPEYMLFFIIRLLVLITVIQRIPFRISIFIIIYIYLCIRLRFYRNIFPYLGLIFVPLVIKIDKQQQNLSNLITDFFKETIKYPILIIDAQSKQPLFHTNQIESDFNYSINNQKNFINTLKQFQDSAHKSLSQILDEQKLLTTTGDLTQYCKLQVISNEDYSYMDSPQNKKISTFIHDEINEDKQQLVVQSPKSQIDTPQKIKKSKFGQFKDSQYLLDKINELKQKKLNIQVQHCIWNYKEAYMIQLKDLRNQQMIETLNEELEESKRQNENKDQILATVFHDFKTPINGISTIVEAMEEKFEINSQQKYYLRIIKKNVYLMLYMIQDILDFARIQRNQLRLSISDFYLNEIIEEVVELVAIQAEQKGVVITTNYDLPTYQIYSDPNRIKQILMNFISNSLKFTEQGSITISVTSHQTDKSQHIVRTGSSKNVLNQQQNQQSIGQLRKQLSGISVKSISGSNRMIYTITIADTGCGISEKIKPKLFNMFATFPSKEVQNKCGTGIGLMVCKKLIKLLGPSENIDLWSEQNKGTKMSFQIYSRLSDDPKRSPNYISVFKQENSQKNFNIDNQSQYDEQHSIQQKFVRSSLLYVYQRSVDKQDAIIDFDLHPEYEDINEQKFHNINYMKNQRFPTIGKIRNKEQVLDDSQDVIDPRNRLQKILKNKPHFSILIVDDQPFNVIALKLLLQDISSNITFLEAYNGQQAINKLKGFQKQKNIKYIFMDLLMPIVNGWQATQMIREMIQKNEVDDLKIIAISGYDDENEQERCGNIGFDAFITKPVKLEMIAEVFVQLEKKLSIYLKFHNKKYLLIKLSQKIFVRKLYLDEKGDVGYTKIKARWDELKNYNVSLGNKHFTQQVVEKAKTLSQEYQQRLQDIMIAGLTNDDSSVGIAATRPEDYDFFLFYLEPLIREYHKIEGQTKQEHDWNIPVGEYVLTKIDPKLEKVSMRARVARNVAGYNLSSSMDKDERIKFENQMVEVFEKFGFPGKYHSLTSGHIKFISDQEDDVLRSKHFLFISMTHDNYLMSNGVASDCHMEEVFGSAKMKLKWFGLERKIN